MMTAGAVFSAALISAAATPAKAQWFFGAPAFEEPAEAANAKAQKRRMAKAKKTNTAVAQTEKSKKASAKSADKNAAHSFPPGLMQLVVSIAKQRVTVFSDGKPVAEAPVSTGQAGHPTPLGIFSVISKARHHVSNIYSGAPMPYMHRITWSGIAMHEGMLPGYPASHGCIRMPGHFVSKLFAASKVGMRVVITREPAAPFEFASARLPVPKAAEDIPLAAFDPVPDAQRVIEAAIAKENIKDGLISDAKAKTGGVQFADAKPNDVTGTLSGVASITADTPQTPGIAKPIAELPKRKGPVQIFVSRKEGKMYVRQGFGPLFDVPVKIAAPEQPWGTHIFTIMDIQDGKARWTALTIPSGYATAETKVAAKNTDRRGRAISQKEIERREKRAQDLANAPTADVALERFELPQDAIARIAPLLAAGSSLIVSDNGLSDETGADTDFIVATR